MRLLLCLAVFLTLCGCHTDMWTQPQTRALEPSTVFADGRSARVPPAGTVAFASPSPTTPFESGLMNGQPIQTAPAMQAAHALRLTTLKDLLARGQERFNIFCSPCHGRLGDGQGMISQRGLVLVRQPRNLHSARILGAPDGHIFRVITHGYGAMMSYEDRIPTADRWAIVAYVRALQLSENAGGANGS